MFVSNVDLVLDFIFSFPGVNGGGGGGGGGVDS